MKHEHTTRKLSEEEICKIARDAKKESAELEFKYVKIFDYLPELDAFKITKEYNYISRSIHLREWNPAVWIGRFFLLDNDYGEHWFDNWEEREELAQKIAEKHNLPPKCNDYTEILVRWHDKINSTIKNNYAVDCLENLFIVNPARFTPRHAEPCHTDEQRKRFWTDACKSLHLSLETIFEEAREHYKKEEKLHKNHQDYPFTQFNIESRITKIMERCKDTQIKSQKGMIKIFDYTKPNTELFCTKEYKEIAGKLNLYERKKMDWPGDPVRWIGRLFTLDQDYGKYWLENWEYREMFKPLLEKQGIDPRDAYMISPDRFCDGDDGPCHTASHRHSFWQDVLRSLHLSHETLFEEARTKYKTEMETAKSSEHKRHDLAGFYYGEEHFDLEKNVEEIKEKYR